MKISRVLACLTLLTSATNAVSIPESGALDLLEAKPANVPRSDILSPENALEKRKGGGGKGGGGGGSGGGGGGKSGGSSGGSGRSSPSSNTGGATKSGSGQPRSFGGGGAYGGGAATPYRSGSKTPKGLIAGAVLLPVAALAIFPGLWLYNVYPYYLNQYRFYNQSYHNATANGMNQTLPVTCLCQDYSVCGCDNNDNPQYINDLVGNGSYAALNKTLVTVADVNGTRNLVINGTLPNGTTAPGGTDDDDTSAALRISSFAGYWVMATIVLATVALL